MTCKYAHRSRTAAKLYFDRTYQRPVYRECSQYGKHADTDVDDARDAVVRESHDTYLHKRKSLTRAFIVLVFTVHKCQPLKRVSLFC